MNDDQLQQPAQQTPATSVVKVPSKTKLPMAFKTSLVLFGMAASFILAILPSALVGASNADSPNFIVFLLAGVVGIVFTAIIFGIISKLGFGFNKTVIVLAIGYNALIVITKLILAPMALYLANQNSAFNDGIASPNNPFYYAMLGIGVLILYVTVFRIIYSHFKKRFAAKQIANTLPSTSNAKPKHRMRLGFLITILTIIILSLVGGAWLILIPLLPFQFVLQYLTYIFSGVGITIVLAVISAIIMAYFTFAQVEKQATQTGDATLLACFFWVGLSLMLVYHIMWVVFMITLVTTWPFKTYTPK